MLLLLLMAKLLHGGLMIMSEEAKSIFERENYNIVEEVKPVYAEGLDNVSIVKVVCGDNATFAISDQGHLYAIGQEWSYQIFL
ncbi:unnamed protein product [Rhizophagus irregularis]|nr:unnamed protein product [Rhizophagus irregularis]CAB4417034.1 unnamed protein product [Rhizophagus irregularis]